jgi:predicted  nucleic acid-binding Zn-ribbon protein
VPIQISHVKMTKVLHLYFSGFPQMKIGEKCGIHQSTASRYAQKFEEKASAEGIVAAGKECGIMEAVMALRSLATELYKSKMSIEEAKSGVKMVILFKSLGVPPEEFKVLAKMLKKLKDPDFPKAGMKLIKLEEATGKEYTEIVSKLEQLDEEIAVRQEKIANLQEKQDEEEKALEALELKQKEKEEEVAEFLEEAKKKAAADDVVKEKLVEAGLTLEKIAKLHPIVEKMNGLGISDDDIETFVGERQVLEEKGITWEKFKIVAGALATAGEIDADGLADKMAEFGTLQQAITFVKTDLESLQPRIEELKKEKEQLEAQVDGLGKKKVQLDEEVEHSKALKEYLDKAVNALPSLEKLYNRLERDVSILETKKVSLTE